MFVNYSYSISVGPYERRELPTSALSLTSPVYAQLGHDNCRGTCYGTGAGAEWYPLSGTSACRHPPVEEIEMVELNRAS